MTDIELKSLVLQHDKSIDKMAMSIEHLASSVISSSGKIDTLIEIVGKQNILAERFSIFEISVGKNFDSTFSKLRELESSHNGNGCNALKMNMHKDETATKRLDKIELILEKITDKLKTLEKSETVQGLKIGGFERWIWIVITGLTGILVAKYGA